MWKRSTIFTTRFWNNDFVLTMKKKLLSILCGFCLSAALFSCTDDNTIGTSMQPDQDKIAVLCDTVRVKTETVSQDGVNLRNSLEVLGEFTDPTYGTVKSDFMSQLYCPYNFSFPDDVNSIDSAYMYFYYTKYFGDSTTVHHVNVYEIDKKALDNYTTYLSSESVDDYCSKTKLLASGSFTTGDFMNTDSIKALSTYSAAVRIPVDLSLAERFLADYRADSTIFETPKSFRDYFKGVYVTTDYGNGSLLYITTTKIEMCYNTYLYSYAMKLRDSLVVGASYFPVNKEIKQINRVTHKDLSSYLQTTSTDSLNYIYAPAGMFTKVTIPKEIFAKDTGLLSGTYINGLSLTVNATQVEADKDDPWDYAMEPPESLLLIDASRVDDFFDGFNLSDGMYTFLATYDSDDEDYVFDLSYYAQKMVREVADSTSTDFTPFTEMLLIPVTSVTNDDGDDVRIEHVITPAAVKICSGNHPDKPMTLRIVYSKQ
jgi:hypothetical protein